MDPDPSPGPYPYSIEWIRNPFLVGYSSPRIPTLRCVHYPKSNRLSARYKIKCGGENVILRGIFHVVSGFPLHFMLYRVNLDCFSNSV